MRSNKSTYVKNILLPCLMCMITGVFVGGLIFLFKYVASWVISKSSELYAYVRLHPMFIPALIVGMAVVGLIAAFILRHFPDCRGGGIPTSVAHVRGLIPFNWIKSIVFVFISSMLTYFCGVPLGNEGPSVQMGTSTGRGTVRIFAKNNPAIDRYAMTGGACAAFAAATGSPVSGIFFALEEAHRRMSPMIFMVASMTVLSGVSTAKLLCSVTGTEFSLFGFTIDAILPMQYIWSALVVGLVAGFTAAGFTKLYRHIRHLLKKTLSFVPFTVKIVAIFVLTACIGVVSSDCIGSGHNLIDELIEGHGVWYMLILIFCIRALLLLVANNSDVTGGLFVPTLAFGAVIGSLCGQAMVLLGVLPEEYYPIMVITGIASYLSASSRTPLTAIAFSLEALCGLNNILTITTGVTLAFIVIETLGIQAFTDTVIEGKVEAAHEGKTANIIDTHLTVAAGSFVVGKEIRDLLLPPTCVILSVHKSPDADLTSTAISVGDILHVHYQTFDPLETMKQLEALVGDQKRNLPTRVQIGGEDHHVPEL